MSVILKDADYRHKPDGTRVVTATLYVDSISELPTDASDIPGCLPDDELAAGSTAVNMTSGAVAMFTSAGTWSAWG